MADREKDTSPADLRFEPVKLGVPVTYNGEEITQIRFKRSPKVSDNLRTALGRKNGVTEEQLEVNAIANLCEINPEAFELLELNDWLLVQAKYMSFLPNAPAQQSSDA